MQIQESGNFQKIEIFLSGRTLTNKDFFTKSDPFVKFFVKDPSGKWMYQDRTETIQDDLNPNFKKSFVTVYMFEVKQECKFEVYDDDGGSTDFIGQVETTIGKLMGAQKQTSILNLLIPGLAKSQDCERMQRIFVNVMDWSKADVTLYDLNRNTDGWFGKSDPLLRCQKIRSDNTLLLIHETEVVMNNLNPIWKPFEISVGRLCDGNPDKPFKIQCWDWEKSGTYQFIGEMVTTVTEIKGGKKEFILTNPKHKSPGLLRLQTMQAILKPTFLDYIRGGLQLNLVLAVDFTGSNGIPTHPTSLHFMNPQQMNQYQQAILTVGEILLAYDSDQKVPCFGFGAKTLHCFPLSGNPQQTEALGIQQIMEQYNYALHHLEFSGPTYFGPIIQESMRCAQNSKQEEQNAYSVLLILTDGEIHDMPLTTDLIVQSSHLPLSIIIVGIGNADFNNMEALDGDSGLRNSKGQSALRDLVQFVPFRQFKGDIVQLARHVLAEIPQQVVQYHQLIGKKPNPPIMADINQMGFTAQPTQNLGQPSQYQVPGTQPQQGYVQAPNIPVQSPNAQIPYNPQQSYYAPQQNFGQPPPPQFQNVGNPMADPNLQPYQPAYQNPGYPAGQNPYPHQSYNPPAPNQSYNYQGPPP